MGLNESPSLFSCGKLFWIGKSVYKFGNNLEIRGANNLDLDSGVVLGEHGSGLTETNYNELTELYDKYRQKGSS